MCCYKKTHDSRVLISKRCWMLNADAVCAVRVRAIWTLSLSKRFTMMNVTDAIAAAADPETQETASIGMWIGLILIACLSFWSQAAVTEERYVVAVVTLRDAVVRCRHRSLRIL